MMHPVLAILLSFACIVGFIGSAMLAMEAHVQYRTRATILLVLAAGLCLWGLSASADMTRRAFDNLEIPR